MFCIAVFERSDKRRERIKNLLMRCSFSLNIEIEIVWFTTAEYIDKMERYAQRIQVACISLDNSNAKAAGCILYENNPSALICYYADEDYDIKNVLNSRPIAFFVDSDDETVITKKLEHMILEVMREKRIFYFTTKKTQLAVPIRNILYFQSDLKHVVVHYCDGKEDRLFGKMKDIVNALGESGNLFIRIHKSYFVNGLHVRKLDKSERMIEMFEHSALPISEAQYSQVVVWFETIKR